MLLKTIFMILYPNAKINIGLNILSKRDDGFHNLSSIFYPIYNCYDLIEIIKSETFMFTTSGLTIPNGKNLCVKAFEKIQSIYNISPVHIHLHKMIPIGSGLGGGSSNASFILKALNKIFNLNLNFKELEKISSEIGSDCPFFIDNTPKIVTGKGEIMCSIDLDLSHFEIKLIHSKFSVSTQQAFLNIKPKLIDYKLDKRILNPIKDWKKNIRNDFEENIFKIYPELKLNKEALYKNGALFASMSGTGSTVYGIFNK